MGRHRTLLRPPPNPARQPPIPGPTKKVRREGWEVDRTSIFCENFFAHDEHNARLIWFVLGVAGQGRDVRMREDALHCIMVQARFPNILHSGSLKCGRRWRTIITSLADD
jgi:hypothetical protein